MLIQNPNHIPYVHYKVHYYMINVCLLNFTFLFKLKILMHKYFCQIDDFTMHLNKVHFVESP
jgi:hypothetical protein